jgi:hypothetical protein
VSDAGIDFVEIAQSIEYKVVAVKGTGCRPAFGAFTKIESLDIFSGFYKSIGLFYLF